MDKHDSSAFMNSLSKRIINTPSLAAKNTFFYLQETGCLMPEDMAASQRQGLGSFLIAAVLDGCGEINICGEEFTVNKGECFFIDCRTPHFYKGSLNDPWKIVWIHFNGSSSEQYYQYFLAQSKNVFRPQSFERVTSVIDEIIRVNEHKDTNTEVTTSLLIVELLTSILTAPVTAEKYDSALKQKLSAVNSYISEHFSEDITLEKLASQFYISKYYLTREYKKIYGKTIFQQLITARINYGKKLLRFSDKSVEEIAHLCGFNDQSYFARQFKKSENLTCFAFRKKWRD